MTNKKEKKNKKTIILLIVIFMIALVILGATYAYFATRSSEELEIKVKTDTSTLLTFSTDDTLQILANFDNFGKNNGNQYDVGRARAHLVADEETGSATASYYVYLLITINDLEYTSYKNSDGRVLMAPISEEEKEAGYEGVPELLLTIKDPTGNIVGTSGSKVKVEGLKFYENVTTNDGNKISGFDITEKQGLIKITEDYSIAASPKKTDEWEVTVTLINLNTNQASNTRKHFSGGIVLQNIPMSLTDTLLQVAEKEIGRKTLIYHDGKADYEGQQNYQYEADDLAYRFSGADYRVTEEFNSLYTTINNTIIKLYCGSSDTSVENGCTNSTRYYHLAYDPTNQQYDTYWKAINKAIEDGYVEENVKNYVCFGSDAEECPYDNLYRIIGLFLNERGDYEIKLIKADVAGEEELGTNGTPSSSTSIKGYGYYRGDKFDVQNYQWNDNSSYIWSESKLNKTNLNDYFYNTYLGKDKGDAATSKWQDMIETHTWNTTGAGSTSYYPRDMYNTEIKSGSQKHEAKIGLINITDYAYAAQPESWYTYLNSYSTSTIRDNNWLYTGLYEDTASSYGSRGDYCLFIDSSGVLNYTSYSATYTVRPTFFIRNDVVLESGFGSIKNPYRIAIPES